MSRPLIAPAAEHGQAVGTGQPEVEHHGVVSLGRAEEIGAVAVLRAIHGIAGRGQRVGQRSRQPGLVLHHQHPHTSYISQPQLNPR
jgi:hypothetical protein